MSTDALCLRKRRESWRAHSKPVKPLPTMTTDLFEPTVVGYPHLRAVQQSGELHCQPRLSTAWAELAAHDRRPLRNPAIAEQQKRDGVCGDHAVRFLHRVRDDGCSPVHRQSIVLRTADTELEARPCT